MTTNNKGFFGCFGYLFCGSKQPVVSIEDSSSKLIASKMVITAATVITAIATVLIFLYRCRKRKKKESYVVKEENFTLYQSGQTNNLANKNETLTEQPHENSNQNKIVKCETSQHLRRHNSLHSSKSIQPPSESILSLPLLFTQKLAENLKYFCTTRNNVRRHFEYRTIAKIKCLCQLPVNQLFTIDQAIVPRQLYKGTIIMPPVAIRPSVLHRAKYQNPIRLKPVLFYIYKNQKIFPASHHSTNGQKRPFLISPTIHQYKQPIEQATVCRPLAIISNTKEKLIASNLRNNFENQLSAAPTTGPALTVKKTPTKLQFHTLNSNTKGKVMSVVSKFEQNNQRLLIRTTASTNVHYRTKQKTKATVDLCNLNIKIGTHMMCTNNSGNLNLNINGNFDV